MSHLELEPHLRRFTRAILLGAALACGPARRGGSGPEPAVVSFTNQSLDQATVYAVATGSDFIRIGTVMPGRTEQLVVPSHLMRVGTVNIVARLLAHRGCCRRAPSRCPLVSTTTSPFR